MLYKRERSPFWWTKVSVPGRKGSVRRSTGTQDKRLAQEFEIDLRAELLDNVRKGEDKDYLWNDAVIKWHAEKSSKKSYALDQSLLRWLHPHLDGVRLKDITPSMIERIRIAREVDINPKTGKPVSVATVAHHLKLIRAILRRSRDVWGLVDKIPRIVVPTPKNKRERWLTMEEAVALINQLPQHLADAAMFTLNTGLRAGNVKNLRWGQVDFKSNVVTIGGDEMKNGKSFSAPLNEEAMNVLRSREGLDDCEYVFTYRGKRINEFSTKAWWGALRRVGIENFRWHDLRHTWASWMVQNGTDLHVLQRLGGWSSYDLVLRYAHLSNHQLAGDADALGKLVSRWSWMTKAGGAHSGSHSTK